MWNWHQTNNTNNHYLTSFQTFCTKEANIKISRLVLRVWFILSIIHRVHGSEVHANVIPGTSGVSLTPVRPQLTHYTLRVNLSLQVWVIVQLWWGRNVLSPRRYSRVLEAELMPGLDWREECTGVDSHGWIPTVYACLPGGLEGVASAINHATLACCWPNRGNIGTRRSEWKWDSKYRLRRLWCNFLRQLNAIWQEKRWVSLRPSNEVFTPLLSSRLWLMPVTTCSCWAARVHLSHFSEPHLGRPRIVWQWKREEIRILYLNENRGMRFLSLKLDSRFLTCQGVVEELEGHPLNSPTVIYAFIYGMARMPSWLFLGSKRETVDLFKNRGKMGEQMHWPRWNFINIRKWPIYRLCWTLDLFFSCCFFNRFYQYFQHS